MSALVYDIGLHDGADTAHYLREGSRVVAVDANPAMCAAAETHFRHNIHTGQLTIINRGLAEHKGQLEFWVCDDVSEWSSFHRDIASRNGAKHHATTVDCVPIMDIVDEFGVADYMKIDIEGNDRICIAGLTNAAAPPYISVEMDHARGDEDIQRLAELGYRGFKLICQNNSWHQVTTRNIWFYEWGPITVSFAVSSGGSQPWPIVCTEDDKGSQVLGARRHQGLGTPWIMPLLSGARSTNLTSGSVRRDWAGGLTSTPENRDNAQPTL
jgi:FkbM family methyltransferase